MTDAFFAYSRLLCAAAETGAPLPVSPVRPLVIVVLCVVAGLSTAILLPGRREAATRAFGGVGLLAVGLVLAGLLMRWTTALGGMSVYFWAFSAIALFASVRVVTHTKPVYSALYFVLTVFATGGLFVLMWAEFMAAALVLIYAGAILITYVFVIMLASEAVTGAAGVAADKQLNDYDAISRSPLAASLIGFATAGLLIFLVVDKTQGVWASPGETVSTVARQPADARLGDLGSTQALGRELIENHAINLQLAAVILTLAMVGAITLARRRVAGLASQAASVETVHTPNTPVDDNPHSIPVYGTTNPRQKAYPES